jgi:hypothetical protein
VARPGVARAAQAAREQARRVSRSEDRHPHFADVLEVDPLVVEPHDIDVRLVEGTSLTLSQWVRAYDLQHVIDVDDTVIVQRMANDEWLAVDVIAEKEPTP